MSSYQHQHPSRPHLAVQTPLPPPPPGGGLPPGAQQPMNPSPSRAYSPWAFEVTPPPFSDDHHYSALQNPWGENSDNVRPRTVSLANLPSDGSRTPTRVSSPPTHVFSPPARVSSLQATSTASVAFPEPQLYRSTSQRSTGHKSTKSDISNIRLQRDPSSLSLQSTLYYDDDGYSSASNESHGEEDRLSKELSNVSLTSEEGLLRFQSGKLLENDQEWHRLVPPEAIEALGKTEVQRQSVIFEVFKSEREYVSDLEAVQNVYITPLMQSQPPIIHPNQLQGFIAEVFHNFSQILSHHQRMLGALFDRQQEQHPLIQSIADIILNATLKSDFRSAYETYIKHYPLSESRHRMELRRNTAYQSFIQSASSDPRIRKRDLITFLSRPVTRLPRLNLLLEQILKLTDKEYEHPDLETLPIILGILSDTIKSTQPGIEAAESKVKFWALCESLVYRKGEIIDMDLYDKGRTLVYSGPLSRRNRSEGSVTSSWSGSGWTDLSAALLDNYFLLSREEQRPNGVVKRQLMSRPLYLSFLRLGSFTSPPETRKEHPKDGSVLSGLLYQSTTLYPFTIYHAASKLNRRYTLYASSDAIRKKWRAFFEDAITVHKVRQEGNMFFAPDTVTQQFFSLSRGSSNGTKSTGRINAAVPFVLDGRQYIAVACASGVFVAVRGRENYRKVLDMQPTSMAALQTLGSKTFNKFLVHANGSLLSYSLDVLARIAQGDTDPREFAGSVEKVVSNEVIFFKHLHIGQRVLIVYAAKKLLQVTLSLHVLEVVDVSEAMLTPKRELRGHKQSTSSFRPFGDPGYVPKDAFDVTALVKTIGICARGGILIVDPTNVAKCRVTVVPDFTDANNNQPMANLKSRVDSARPLGLIRSDASELLVIYDTIGCYITKHGAPSRSSGYIKWESKIDAFAQRGTHVLLFSSQFIEIRDILTGRIVQVIEGQDIRMMYAGPTPDSHEPVLYAVRGDDQGDNKEAVAEKMVALQETSEISSVLRTPTARENAAMWEEWDM
ncbi:hypothetical protein GYMLUDRAFT_163599 [Collybiopsis luxurians FD-317 M1]|uniref:Rho1 guanine nucleotide exchange factor 1 n=1 Tax=Collybiopsis luxurians FD-317 M1 TaxID=944289 RepID=A0A0D0C4N8_9AGAR|nr:hypothetical protein GYMLUDRAFT_163599 [Collybiopsis luxurians FD-317 M1]